MITRLGLKQEVDDFDWCIRERIIQALVTIGFSELQC